MKRMKRASEAKRADLSELARGDHGVVGGVTRGGLTFSSLMV